MKALHADQDCASLSIIFVHGLNGLNGLNKTYADKLESLLGWVGSLEHSPKTNFACVHIFGFQMLPFLKGGESALLLLSKSLRDDVDRLSQKDVRLYRLNILSLWLTFPKVSRRFILIGHALAGWVVQEAFASYAANQMAMFLNRSFRGIIFWGLPEIHSVTQWGSYVKQFVPQLSMAHENSILPMWSKLQETIEKFEEFRKWTYRPAVEYTDATDDATTVSGLSNYI